jgi:flagellar L-ring protein precursor FlgH
MTRAVVSTLAVFALLTACGRSDHIGKAPDFSPPEKSAAHNAMFNPGLPMRQETLRPVDRSSLWRARDGSESLGMPGLFGIPQRIDERLPEGAAMNEAVSISSNSSSSGSGSVRRNEKLTLRVAATITQVLPNGVLAISGSQEVRVNHEMRELLVTGYVRPEDISRRNVVTYDKIASARVSYGGRGQISDMQQPRYGQQVLDAVLPF